MERKGGLDRYNIECAMCDVVNFFFSFLLFLLITGFSAWTH